MRRHLPRWTRHFPTWFEPFQVHLHHKARRRLAALYVQGLCSVSHRKSIVPMADLVAPGDEDRFQHFITDSPWSTAALEPLLFQRANQMLGGKGAVLIIDDTCLTKSGTKSVGVTKQYSGQVGGLTQCQCLISLTLAQHDLPVPVSLRLFLPRDWTGNAQRMVDAGVPEEHQHALSKWAVAIDELDRVSPHLNFGMVLADAGYGANAPFRQALSDRNLHWSVGIYRSQKAYPADVQLLLSLKPVHGRQSKYPTPSHPRQTVEEMLADAVWHQVLWRQGTKAALSGRFAAKYVCLADGTEYRQGQHLPSQSAWIIGEERRGGERKYYACNLPPETALHHLVEGTKRRWACELTHRELKQEVGLDHFEGRSWRGLHHHALLCMVALLFLQWLRLSQPDDLIGDSVPTIRDELAAGLLPACYSRCCPCTGLFSGP
ncbi:IS701 family transposase [Deinococcus sp. HMF7620]|uniref:IS701 family transposase n=1 Tax=Deinococcus arboris TaxID=2682977 RepID=A0A7C9MBR5_9DEIO|nr:MULTISPECIES: IS701 family transposase [Deinococcus]MBZ9752825.1 IS701 family transposase [Deinococcus betulae]MVN89323.1 IS701 family transposase [Deinococcus arboris]